MKAFFAAGSAVTWGAAAFLIFSGFKYTRMISNIFLSLVYKASPEPPVSAAGERLTVLDSSDREIEMLWAEKKGSKKVLLFCHESGASKESWERYAYFLPALGFHVLSIDYSDPSTRPATFSQKQDAGLAQDSVKNETNNLSQWPTRDNVERVVTVIRWTKKAIAEDVSIVLFGVSNGADIALGASFEDSAVKAVVADGLFSMKEIFRDYIRRWAPILVRPNFFGENYPDWVVNIFTDLSFWYSQKKSRRRFIDAEKLLRVPHVPLLMIHGGTDDYIPPKHQQFLKRLSAGRGVLAQHWGISAAGHNQCVTVDRRAYEKRVVEFLEGIR